MYDLQKYKHKEYFHFDGEEFITFDIIAIGEEEHILFVAVTNRGKVSVNGYELALDKTDEPYFYYGSPEEKIYLSDFEETA